MKILVIGDFHGKVPIDLNGFIEKEGVDCVVSVGDYLPFLYRKIWFKYCYRTDVNLWDIVGKKRYKELIKKEILRGEKILKKLNKLKVPVFTTFGNVDHPSTEDVSDHAPLQAWKWERGRSFFLEDLVCKYSNIRRIDYRAKKFKDLILIGMRGHSYPGHVKSKNFRKHKKKLDKLFVKFKKENNHGKVIFVSHNIPYNTKLDKVNKETFKIAGGKHLGSKLAKRIVEQQQPVLALGGHIHEGFGKTRIGKTIVVNSGSVMNNQKVLIDFDEVQGKVNKVKFLK